LSVLICAAAQAFSSLKIDWILTGCKEQNFKIIIRQPVLGAQPAARPRGAAAKRLMAFGCTPESALNPMISKLGLVEPDCTSPSRTASQIRYSNDSLAF
jgi:hypothetical protein